MLFSSRAHTDWVIWISEHNFANLIILLLLHFLNLRHPTHKTYLNQ